MVARRPAPKVIVGFLLLALVVAVAWHLGDARKFAEIADRARPAWLLAAVLMQAATYLCAGGVWRIALGRSPPLSTLVLLSVAKVFTDQALPSAGISGTLLFVRAVVRRGTSRADAAAALVVNLLAFYAAFALAAAASLFYLTRREGTSTALVAMAAAMLVVAVVVPSVLLGLLRGGRSLRWLARFRAARSILDAFAEAPRERIRRPLVLAGAFALQLLTIALDGGTLFATLVAVGDPGQIGVAMASFVFAMIAEVIGFVPGGLGTFEGTCVALLHASGVGLERALAATLLLRGLTFWLPMVPGVWLAQRELKAADGSGEGSSPTAGIRFPRARGKAGMGE